VTGRELVRRADVEPVASPLEEQFLPEEHFPFLERELGRLQIRIHRG
jgi:hypothetical protein